MSVVVTAQALVVSSAQPLSLASVFQVTAASSNPAYLILNGVDRDEYSGSSGGATGRLNGTFSSAGFGAVDGDARELGVVFQYQAASGRYVSSQLGYFDQLTFMPSTRVGDITDLSLFGTSSARLANSYASSTIALIQADAGGFLGTVTVATEPGFAGPVPAQATPSAIAAIAEGFVGRSWNMNGCWVLASTIAAEAGASLPVQSTVDVAGQANGEWTVAYNGPAGSSGDWQSMVRTGDVIGFVTGAGGGHITTCVAGSGGSAMLVDNVTLVDAAGNVANPANDGSAVDVIIEAPHAARDEWSGVPSSSVVIYRLDTPVVAESATSVQLPARTTEGLASLFSATDPAGRPVTEFQVSNDDPNDTVLVNGVAVAAETAASAATVASLSQVALGIGAAGGRDVVSVRAFNGLYWGDWLGLAVNSAGVAPPSATSAPGPSATSSPIGASPAGAASALPLTGSASIYRFFNTADGTHFFTASASERDGLIATRPDLAYEGVGLGAVGTPSGDPAAAPVYRFFDKLDGTHFFTADARESANLVATRPDMSFEGVAFYEEATAQAGDSAVYRFFDSAHGTHLYTESAAERAMILASRPDLTPEGIAFYAPSLR